MARSVRIAVHLSRLGRTIWSKNYDVFANDQLAVQVSSATQIGRAMNIVADTEPWLWRASTENASVALPRGLLAIDEKPAALQAALSHIDQVLQLDPDFAEAMSAKAFAYLGASNWFVVDVPTAVARMKILIDDALAIDPESGLAWSLAARVRWYELDFAGAEAARANAVRFGRPQELLDVAEQLNFCGRFDEALGLVNRALRANPRDLLLLRAKGSILAFSRRYGEAPAVFGNLLAETPNDIRTRYWKGSVLEAMGRYEEAIELQPWGGLMRAGYKAAGVPGIGEAFLGFARQIERGETTYPRQFAWRWYAWAYARLGNYAEAVRWMEKGWQLGDRWYYFYYRVLDMPALDQLRASPGFKELMARTIGNPPTCPGYITRQARANGGREPATAGRVEAPVLSNEA